MIDEDPPDPVEQGSVGGGDQNEILNPPQGHQRSPTNSLPDFDDVIELPGGALHGEIMEEIPASPITPEAQIEQIEADNALAQQIQADEQMGVDQALAQQLQAPYSITVPRPWPENGHHPETADTPGARGSNYIQLPNPNDPAEHQQLLPVKQLEKKKKNELPKTIRVTPDEIRTQESAPTPAKEP